MATLSQIADEAGVSVDTASRVLNRSWKSVYPRAQARAQRIREIADRVGYRPHAAARATVSGRFGHVAMLTRNDLGEIQLNLNKGAFEAATAEGLHLTYAEIAFEKLTDPDYSPQVLSELCVDGLIVHYAWDIPRACRDTLRAAKLPLVWVNTKGESNCVYPDDQQAAQDAVARLIGLGHRRVGYLIGRVMGWDQPASGKAHYSCADRLAGCVAAASAAGLQCRTADVSLSSSMPLDATVQTLGRVLDEQPDVTAWVCQHERVALPLVMAALTRGLRVPRDLSVVTFADARHDAIQTGIGISRLCVPMAEVGRCAVSMLCQRIRSAGESQASRSIAFAPEGPESIAPPPQPSS